MNPQYRILAISGSLRSRSSNTDILRAAAQLAPPEVEVTLEAGLDALPYFNPDLDQVGIAAPAAVEAFRSRIADADALLICSPEYAHGVPGVLKNALDWLVSSPAIVYKPVGLLNASPRATHAQAALAEILRTMAAVLVPEACITLPALASSERAGAIQGAIAALVAISLRTPAELRPKRPIKVGEIPQP